MPADTPAPADAERLAARIRDALLRAEATLDGSKPFHMELAHDRHGNLRRVKTALAELDELEALARATLLDEREAEVARLRAILALALRYGEQFPQDLILQMKGALANPPAALDHTAQSSREAALTEAAELVEEASKAPKDWTWGRLKTAIHSLITKGEADAV